jgi:hypothetical protein
MPDGVRRKGWAVGGRRGMQAGRAALLGCRGDGGRFMRDRREDSPKTDEREGHEGAERTGALLFYRLQCFFSGLVPHLRGIFLH